VKERSKRLNLRRLASRRKFRTKKRISRIPERVQECEREKLNIKAVTNRWNEKDKEDVGGGLRGRKGVANHASVQRQRAGIHEKMLYRPKKRKKYKGNRGGRV